VEFSFFFPTDVRGGEHITGCLMQGLHLLGHKIYSNLDPAKFSSNGIETPFSSLFYDAVEITSDLSRGHLIVDYFNGFGKYSDYLIESSKKNRIVLLDMNDNSNFRDYHENFLVFSVHFNRLARRRGRIFPIGFGVSQEAIELSKRYEMMGERNGILLNFRPSDRQSVRNSLDLALVPNLNKYFSVNTKFSQGDLYLNDLVSHKAVLAYGGDFYKDLRLNSYFMREGKNQAHDFEYLVEESVILRFDSWRFYETALFGACPISLDLDRYGLDTSFNPKPWKEYIPIDFADIGSTALELVAHHHRDPLYFDGIGRNARDWVLAHHSPEALAKRILSIMESEDYL